jgi:hypothetical protein
VTVRSCTASECRDVAPDLGGRDGLVELCDLQARALELVLPVLIAPLIRSLNTSHQRAGIADARERAEALGDRATGGTELAAAELHRGRCTDVRDDRQDRCDNLPHTRGGAQARRGEL